MKALILSVLMLASMTIALPAEAKNPKTEITCSVTASDRLVEKGEKVTITWKSLNSFVTYGPGNKRVAGSGTMTVSPTETTIYKFKFVGVGGNEKCGVRVRVIGDEPKD